MFELAPRLTWNFQNLVQRSSKHKSEERAYIDIDQMVIETESRDHTADLRRWVSSNATYDVQCALEDYTEV
jgi:hypothetical protein